MSHHLGIQSTAEALSTPGMGTCFIVIVSIIISIIIITSV